MIGVRGSVTGGQSTSNQTAAFGTGWQPGDSHLIIQAAKAGADSVAPNPSGYLEFDAVTASGGGLTQRASLRVLQSGDVAPTLVQSSVSVLYVSATFSGSLIDTAANLLAATTPDHTTNSSNLTVNYALSGNPTEDNCAVLLYGRYNSADIGSLGTPTTFPVGAAKIFELVGTNMHVVLWMALQTAHVQYGVGNIPITSGSTQTNRSLIFTLRQEPTVVTSGGRNLMMMGVG
jgi:hypothetical protein